ncbi:hypothetical protein [Cupriavidus sp. AU9028]|uniref:hypothetical protein n=1 Tax=Cupriavidus sp. AU9028 TaxID=2871157 RepID=UPI001C948BDE|nr:hypothetical protein [Cupriavidus sp. AU9028]MBY4897971.1 hypothetical protein [Cupriavidus sp. AU9028]
MKVLLRAVLFFDALFDLMLGIVLLISPFATFYAALQLPQPQPALYGQLLGVGMIGFAALMGRAAFQGALTVPVARTVGWVNLVSALLIGGWLMFFQLPVQGAGRIWLPLLAVMLGFFAVLQLPLAARVRNREREERLRQEMQAAQAPGTASPLAGMGSAADHPASATTDYPDTTATNRGFGRNGTTAGPSTPSSTVSPEIRREPVITPPPGYGPGTEVVPDDQRTDKPSPHHARQNPYS